MIGWIIFGAWLAGWAVFAPLIARLMAKDMPPSDGFDKFTCVFLGGLGALFWPLVIPGVWVYKQVFGPGKKDEK